ncbi:MAG: endo alpha-1,4 polygalactosaminidase [Spirochaetes bacterium]|nr:endo alpha-1,4 polygalactosaminidase [Spirochaetota bacterium]
MKRFFSIFFIILITTTLCNAKADYRQKMRELVIAISKEAKKHNPAFYVIGQNALELVTINGKPKGKVAIDYINALDGTGIEELFYGYENKDGVKTPEKITQYFLSYLKIFSQYKKPVLVIDYPTTFEKARDSYQRSSNKGFISFQTNRACSIIPSWMFSKNEDAVTELSQAKNFLYLINPEKFKSKEEFIKALSLTWYDVLIIDAFFWDQLFSKSEVMVLQKKPNGARRLVLAYMSVGEAEDYRYYWKHEWKKNKPWFLEKENPDWKGNWKVRYWDTQWHRIIYGAGDGENFIDSYIGKIIYAGFDGVYMDVLDAAIYFEEMK